MSTDGVCIVALDQWRSRQNIFGLTEICDEAANIDLLKIHRLKGSVPCEAYFFKVLDDSIFFWSFGMIHLLLNYRYLLVVQKYNLRYSDIFSSFDSNGAMMLYILTVQDLLSVLIWMNRERM